MKLQVQGERLPADDRYDHDYYVVVNGERIYLVCCSLGNERAKAQAEAEARRIFGDSVELDWTGCRYAPSGG